MANDYRASLDRGEYVVHNLVSEPDTSLFVNWSPYLDHGWQTPAKTGVKLKKLQEVANKIQPYLMVLRFSVR